MLQLHEHIQTWETHSDSYLGLVFRRTSWQVNVVIS